MNVIIHNIELKLVVIFNNYNNTLTVVKGKPFKKTGKTVLIIKNFTSFDIPKLELLGLNIGRDGIAKSFGYATPNKPVVWYN